MKLSSGVNVILLVYFVSAIVDRQTGAAVAPDNRTVTSPEQSRTAQSVAQSDNRTVTSDQSSLSASPA